MCLTMIRRTDMCWCSDSVMITEKAWKRQLPSPMTHIILSGLSMGCQDHLVWFHLTQNISSPMLSKVSATTQCPLDGTWKDKHRAGMNVYHIIVHLSIVFGELGNVPSSIFSSPGGCWGEDSPFCTSSSTGWSWCGDSPVSISSATGGWTSPRPSLH